ncbi:hypothetical protein [Rhodococcus sp. NPDC058514]|uniref:hypothetical protein n=1 Tax=unclassified Rhodococcus (in: high G+C Gram-positive bacteria) TaxID=192944 RepID=UPI00364A5FE6
MNLKALSGCAALGGLAAGIALASTMPGDYAIVTDDARLDILFYSDVAGAALGAVVATLVAWWVRGQRRSAGAALAGIALLAVAALSGTWQFELYPNAIGAGLLLGGLAGLCTSSLPQAALAAGVIAGSLVAGPLETYRQSSMPRRYADYLVDAGRSTDSSGPAGLVVLVLLASTAALLIVALVRSGASPDHGPGEPGNPAGARGRQLVVGILVPLVGLALYWWFVRTLETPTTGTPGRWVCGIAVVPVVLAAALWLPGRLGAVLLGSMAFIAAAETGYPGGMDRHASPWLLVTVVLVLLGALLGRRLPRPLAGVAALAVVAASATLDQPPWDNLHIGAVLLGLPLAAGYTVVASLPSSPSVTSTALAAPAVLVVPFTAQFGWTAYSPLTERALGSPSVWSLASAAVPVAVIVACGVAMGWVRRRPAEPELS